MRRSSSSILVVALSFVCATARVHRARSDDNGWDLKEFKTLVTFGDSYTDETRLGYFGSHNGSAPPVGWVEPMGTSTSTGGLIWPRYVSIYANTHLYDYAVSGAVCSNQITPRTWSTISAPFPDIASYELPAFIADSHHRTNGTAFLSIPSDKTVYAIWIGTNDLGNDALLTDSQVRGKTIADYVDCVYATIDAIYANGARYFVLMNIAPLNLLPQYATPENGGLPSTQYFKDKPSVAGGNTTEISFRMLETVVTVNEIFKYRTAYETQVAGRWDDANIALFDTNALITDIWTHPGGYLNGTAPANVTGFVNHCTVNGTGCVRQASPDSYLWYDELHPSEQTDRVIARSFVDVVRGESKWATYW